MIEFPATRWSLIARLPEQPQHTATLLSLYADAVGLYVARKLAGERPERIEDIVQEVLLDLLGKPDLLARAQPGEGSRFRHYLMNLAWGSARNALRRSRRHETAAHLEEDLPGGAPAPDQQQAMDRAWALSVIQQSLDELQRWSSDGTLEPEAYAILRANLIDGTALRDLAATHGLSLATCSRRLARARHLFQDAVAERLRSAGELGSGGDPQEACAVLLSALGGG